MCTTDKSSDPEQESLCRFQWVLDHPRASPWFKEALRTALVGDPIQVLNEVEMLRELLRSRSETMVDRLYSLMKGENKNNS
ncbi:hypothetical protein GJ689_23920 [Rhodoplanes serenus]|uniref:Uncharacterized protein n=1 Tax=Rhodoplanes serenus TaxID=200615 RepID=A0A9X5AVN2_9BRAD|nr:hypothetical protein [Rhodoplanes serenus]MTW19248.1 hypothetical protein [Rhodoplanes serenus]